MIQLCGKNIKDSIKIDNKLQTITAFMKNPKYSMEIVENNHVGVLDKSKK